VAFFLFVAAILFLGYRLTSSEDRARFLNIALANFQQLKAAATKPRPEMDAFAAALDARGGRPLLTFAMIALFGAALVKGLVPSIGIRTTNGEWWRLLTSPFAHPTLLQLLVNAAAIYQVGTIVERLAGRAAVAVVFFSAAIIAGLVSIAVQPVAPISGATGALFGLYGLLIAAVILSRLRSEVPDEFRISIPWQAVRRVAVVAGIVMATNGVAGAVPLAGLLSGLGTGLACGLALMRGVAESTPPAQRTAATAGTVLVLAVVTAWPLSGIADVRPEIARLLETEDRTKGAYLAAMDELKRGKTSVTAVAQLIDGTIAHDLRTLDDRLKALKKVPPEHQGMVNDAEEFLRLRTESWRLRSETLRASARTPSRKRTDADVSADASWRMGIEKQFRSTRVAIGKAEAVERSSLEVLARLKSVV
jgi:membrane associated rhomboid family serine protease